MICLHNIRARAQLFHYDAAVKPSAKITAVASSVAVGVDDGGKVEKVFPLR